MTRREVFAPHKVTNEAQPSRPVVDHELTVVIPAFNEQNRLPATLRQLRATLDQWDLDYRVVVADDGSSDATATLTDPMGPRFSTHRLSRHRGKGYAVRNAMLHATGRVIGFTDADLPYELTALRQAFEWIRRGDCQVVFGARDMEQSTHVASRRLARTLATLGFRQAVKYLISRHVTDTQCGLKVFGGRAAREIFSRTAIDGFAFDAEVVFLTEKLGLPYRRVPVSLIHDYASTLSLRRHALPMLWDVIRLRLRDWRTGRMVRPIEMQRQDEFDDEQRKRAA